MSNEVSRERGLSVIKPEGKGRSYAEWSADREGRATVRGLVRADIDSALTDAADLPGLFTKLAGMGYTVKRGPTITHTALRPPGGQRFIRLDSLGERYTEEALQTRIERGDTAPAQAPAPCHPLPPPKLYHPHRPLPKRRRKLHGFRALYVKYLYLLGAIPKRKPPKRAAFLLRDEVTKFNRYVAEFKLLERYRIDTQDQLTTLTDALQAEMDALTEHRADLYRLRRQDPGDEALTEGITATTRLRDLRRSFRLCAQVQEHLPRIQSQTKIPKEKEREAIKKQEEKRRVKNKGYRSR